MGPNPFRGAGAQNQTDAMLCAAALASPQVDTAQEGLLTHPKRAEGNSPPSQNQRSCRTHGHAEQQRCPAHSPRPRWQQSTSSLPHGRPSASLPAGRRGGVRGKTPAEGLRFVPEADVKRRPLVGRLQRAQRAKGTQVRDALCKDQEFATYRFWTPGFILTLQKKAF